MNLSKGMVIVVALLGVWTAGLASCYSAGTAQPTPKPAPAGAAVLGVPFTGQMPIQWVEDVAELPLGTVNHVDVVYFHRAQRCTSCVNAETYTRETIEAYFASQLKDGWLSFRVLNMENPENAALVQKFDVAGSSLYLSVVIRDTEYLFADESIWFLTSNRTRFVDSMRKKLTALTGRS